MALPLIAQIYCLCAGIGCLTVLVSALTGAMHQGSHGGHAHGHAGHAGHGGGHHGGGHHGGGHNGHVAKVGHGHGGQASHTGQAHHGAQAHHGQAAHHAHHGAGAQGGEQSQTGGLIRLNTHETHLSIEEDEPGIGIALLTYLNPNTIACFATWFGAIGIMLWRLTPLSLMMTLPIAIAGGVVGAKFMLWMTGCIGTRLYQSSTFRTDDIIGLAAEVTVPVQGQGIGEVIYVVGGTRHTSSARANKPDLTLARGSKAIICDIRDDVAYIEPWTDALAFDDTP